MSDDGLFNIGPDGTPIKLDYLPPRGFKDWQPRHKAIVVAAVRHGLITVDQACARYDLSIAGCADCLRPNLRAALSRHTGRYTPVPAAS